MTSIALRYDELLVRSAVWSFWRRVVGWRFVVALLLTGLSSVSLYLSGDRSWWLGLFCSTFVGGLGFAVALFVVHYRGAMGRLRRMKEPHAVLELSDQTLRVTSDVGSSELMWSAFPELWKFEDYWLLFLNRAQFMILPLGAIDVESRQFIESQIRSNGGKVA